jgi:hypothetical protein
MTKFEETMRLVLTRLSRAPQITPLVRRAHRTVVPRDKAPAIHLIDGDIAAPMAGAKNCRGRDAQFTVSLFVRSDDGPEAADPYKEKIYERLRSTDWPEGVIIAPGRVTSEAEIADADVIRIDLDFSMYYVSGGEWFI